MHTQLLDRACYFLHYFFSNLQNLHWNIYIDRQKKHLIQMKKRNPVILQICHLGQYSSPTQNSLSSAVTVWQPPVHPSQMVPGCYPTITGSRSPFPRWQCSSHPTLRMLATSYAFKPENVFSPQTAQPKALFEIQQINTQLPNISSQLDGKQFPRPIPITI